MRGITPPLFFTWIDTCLGHFCLDNNAKGQNIQCTWGITQKYTILPGKSSNKISYAIVRKLFFFFRWGDKQEDVSMKWKKQLTWGREKKRKKRGSVRDIVRNFQCDKDLRSSGKIVGCPGNTMSDVRFLNSFLVLVEKPNQTIMIFLRSTFYFPFFNLELFGIVQTPIKL